MDQASRETGITMQGYCPSILATGILGPQSAEVLSGIIYPGSADQHPASSSPLFLLHELMTTTGILSQPEFEFTEIATHQGPMYNCKAKIFCGNEVIQEIGTAITKKDAKNRAVYQVIQALKSRKICAMPSHQRRYSYRRERKTDVETVQSPISMLTEFCNRSMLNPVFTFSESGPIHMRKFDCEVIVRDPMSSHSEGASASAKGEGKTKKDAKHDAARNLMKNLCPEISDKLDSWFQKVETTSKIEKADFEQVPGNPLSELNDMCMKTKKLIPEYIEEEPEGSPHERVFTIICKLSPNLMEKGQGSSKKNAKRVAAYKMLQKIKEIPVESKGFDETVEAKLQNLSLSVKTTEGKFSPAEIVRNFSKRQGTILEAIRGVDQSKKTNDAVKLLNEVAQEQKLRVDWIDLQDPVNAEKFQLLIVSCQPDICLTFFGKGENRNKCRRNAADNALLFMRLTSELPA